MHRSEQCNGEGSPGGLLEEQYHEIEQVYVHLDVAGDDANLIIPHSLDFFPQRKVRRSSFKIFDCYTHLFLRKASRFNPCSSFGP
jgi:hypothetical protein